MTHRLPLHTGHSLAPGQHPVPCQRTWVIWPPVCSYMTNDKQSLQPDADDILKKGRWYTTYYVDELSAFLVYILVSVQSTHSINSNKQTY